MPRSIVGLLAAVGAAMSALASLAHGDLIWVAVADAAAATGLASYLALAPTKNLTATSTQSPLRRHRNSCATPSV